MAHPLKKGSGCDRHPLATSPEPSPSQTFTVSTTTEST